MSAAFRPDIAPVQAQAQPQSATRRARAGQPGSPDEVHTTAASGTRGLAQALPSRAEIEAATGRDLAGVKPISAGRAQRPPRPSAPTRTPPAITWCFANAPARRWPTPS
ncbi:MAG: hypothetical protein Tsb0020_35820 [Haliangiales bacterium]